jgi:metallo-beta-lactamase class B
MRSVCLGLIKNISFAIIILAACASCGFLKNNDYKPKKVFVSSGLVVSQIAPNAFGHISYKQTDEFGYVPCNGLVVRNGNEAIVFDTPTTDTSAEKLIKWVEGTLRCKVKAVVPTHFHDDCLGGLNAFHAHGIPSYAYFKTIELAKENKMAVPQNAFKDSMVLNVGNSNVLVRFFGEGHTKDNVIGYYSGDNIVFGGCLIKAVGASKGYLGDANVLAWSSTVEQIKERYPNVKYVVPGHGKYGGKKLLDYTIDLFKER